MDKKLKEAVIKALKGIKAEVDKRNEIYQHGIDLINYENGYQTELLNLLKVIMNDKYNNISWYLYEDAPKIIYFKNGKQRDLTKVEDLVKYLIEGMEDGK